MRFRYLGAIGLLSGLAVADPAPSVNLSVAAAITPGVCSVTFDKNALDFGAYGYHDLDPDAWTTLDSRGVRLEVSCGRATTAAIDVVDNVADPESTDSGRFSLGLQGEQSIGWYSVSVANHEHDGRTGIFIRQEAADTWRPTNSLAKNTQHAWATIQNQQPATFSTARVTLNVTPNIVPRKLLDTAQPLELQGNMSIALRYL